MLKGVLQIQLAKMVLHHHLFPRYLNVSKGFVNPSGPALPASPAKSASSIESPPDINPIPSRSASPSAPHLLMSAAGPGGRPSRRARKTATHLNPGATSRKSKPTSALNSKGTTKKGRRWDADGMVDEEDDIRLDFSTHSDASATPSENASAGVLDTGMQDLAGKRTSNGEYVLKDLDEEVHSILSSANAKKTNRAATSPAGSTLGGVGSLFRNFVGGKTLTKADLDKPIKGMEEHLLKKNVAREAAIKLCEGVEQSLIGVKTGSFQSEEFRLISFSTRITTNSFSRH